MTVAVLKMIAFGGIIFGSVLFNLILKKLPIVVLMLVTCIIYCLTSGAEMMFLLEVTLGISPVVFFAVVSIFDAAAIQAFFAMPLLAIFAKLVPTSIESSMFAMLTGLINLSFQFLSKILGVLINMFFGVTNENLVDLWKLYLIQSICGLLPLALLWLLPTPEEITEVQ